MNNSTMRRTVLVVVVAIAVMVPTAAQAAVATAPTGLVAIPGNVQASLSWVVPGSDGESAISDYIVEYSPDAGTTYNRFSDGVGVGLSATVTGLTNNTAYLFRVAAVNGDGTGPFSTTATTTPFVVHSAANPAMFSACPTGVAPAAGFTDTAAADVDCVKYYGITKGVTATTYGPIDAVTRWQMALFLTRMAGPAGVTVGSGIDQGFVDIGGKSSEIQTAINQIRQLGITVGKTATTYAPDDNVSREEMALFIARFLKKATVGPGGHTEYVSGTGGSKEIKSNDTDHNFTDLTSLALWESQATIKNLWNLGVTDVQSSTLYEPTAVMTRAAMATFMTRAMAHTNARPAGFHLQASTYRVQGTPLVTFSVTHRSAAFSPVVGTQVDSFRFTHTIAATPVRFDTAGKCSGTVVTVVGSTKCTIDLGDRITDSTGNLATFDELMSAAVKEDIWAWTAASGTEYDNDIHADAASKVTVETYP